MSDEPYMGTTSEMVRDARAIVSGVKHHMLSGEWFDRMIESVRAEARERIARNIEVKMRQYDRAQVGFSAIGDAYADAARIAREGA